MNPRQRDPELGFVRPASTWRALCDAYFALDHDQDAVGELVKDIADELDRAEAHSHAAP